MPKRLVLSLTLLLLIFISAVAVVYMKHENRKAFISLQQLEKERDSLNTEWGKLQLEQSTWATHARIERVARESLQMQVPQKQDVIFVTQ